jgi:hypothetical protein
MFNVEFRIFDARNLASCCARIYMVSIRTARVSSYICIRATTASLQTTCEHNSNVCLTELETICFSKIDHNRRGKHQLELKLLSDDVILLSGPLMMRTVHTRSIECGSEKLKFESNTNRVLVHLANASSLQYIMIKSICNSTNSQ